MRLTFTGEGSRACLLELDGAMHLRDLSAILEAELGIPSSELLLSVGGRPPVAAGASTASLSSLGARDGDAVVAIDGSARAAAGNGGSGASRAAGRGGRGLRVPRAPTIDPASYGQLSFDTLPPGTTPLQLWEILRVNAGMRGEVSPALAAAAMDPTSDSFKRVYLRAVLDRTLPEAQRESRRAQMEARLAANPMDVEANRFLEEEIAQRNVEENMETAWEEMPEAFTK